MKRVLVTGATSQISRLLIPRLAKAGYPILATSRRVMTQTAVPDVTWLQTDLQSTSSLPPQLAAVDTLIHLAPVYVLPDFLLLFLASMKVTVHQGYFSTVSSVQSAEP